MKKLKTKEFVELALLIAIIIVLAFTPLGYIKMPGLEITLIVVPVAVGAVTLGPVGGLVLGAVFGITSFIQCFGMSPFGTMLLGINPVGTFVVCVVARVLTGWLTGVIFQALQHLKGTRKISVVLANLACPLMNTFFFMLALVLFFYRTDYIQGMVSAMNVANPFAFVVAFVGVNGLVEAAACFIVGSAISKALQTALKNS